MSRRRAEQPPDVRAMFERISPHYDLLNRIMSFGCDRTWRRAAVGMARLPVGGRLLDAGAGTGDLAFEALRRDPSARVVGMDFTRTMLDVGRRRPHGERVLWCRGDALELPFPDAVFDAVVSGFLVRNLDDVMRAFGEQRRVVVPGGRVVCLDTSPPPRNLMRPFVLLHLRLVIPTLGFLIARNRAAYTYLPSSTRAFLTPRELASRMAGAGLVNVRCRRFMFGTIAVHAGVRPG